MAEFYLTGLVTISVYTKVEADTLEEAIELAKDRHIESGNFSDKDQLFNAWISDEFDGEVYRIEQENED